MGIVATNKWLWYPKVNFIEHAICMCKKKNGNCKVCWRWTLAGGSRRSLRSLLGTSSLRGSSSPLPSLIFSDVGLTYYRQAETNA